MKSVYTCSNYQFENLVLTVYKHNLIGMVNDVKSFNELISKCKYDAIVCPELFRDENGVAPEMVVFLA
jgi:hypothetical protein